MKFFIIFFNFYYRKFLRSFFSYYGILIKYFTYILHDKSTFFNKLSSIQSLSFSISHYWINTNILMFLKPSVSTIFPCRASTFITFCTHSLIQTTFTTVIRNSFFQMFWYIFLFTKNNNIFFLIKNTFFLF